jgi:hypothetical protein
MRPFVEGFSDELIKIAGPLSFLAPAARKALLVGAITGATGLGLANLVSPDRDEFGRKKHSVLSQATKGAIGGATTGLVSHVARKAGTSHQVSRPW